FGRNHHNHDHDHDHDHDGDGFHHHWDTAAHASHGGIAQTGHGMIGRTHGGFVAGGRSLAGPRVHSYAPRQRFSYSPRPSIGYRSAPAAGAIRSYHAGGFSHPDAFHSSGFHPSAPGPIDGASDPYPRRDYPVTMGRHAPPAVHNRVGLVARSMRSHGGIVGVELSAAVAVGMDFDQRHRRSRLAVGGTVRGIGPGRVYHARAYLPIANSIHQAFSSLQQAHASPVRVRSPDAIQPMEDRLLLPSGRRKGAGRERLVLRPSVFPTGRLDGREHLTSGLAAILARVGALLLPSADSRDRLAPRAPPNAIHPLPRLRLRSDRQHQRHVPGMRDGNHGRQSWRL